MIPSASQELISSKPFVIHGSLTCQGKVYSIQILIDTGCTGYAFIDRKLVGEICDLLGIVPMPLAKPKPVRGFDGKISKALITHALYPNLSLRGHSEATAPMLITDLGQHAAILGKPWMNRFGVLLDMSNDSLIFRKNGDHAKTPPSLPAAPPTPREGKSPPKPTPKILSRPQPAAQESPFSIYSVGAAAFALLADQCDTQLFAMSMEDIDNRLLLDRESKDRRDQSILGRSGYPEPGRNSKEASSCIS